MLTKTWIEKKIGIHGLFLITISIFPILTPLLGNQIHINILLLILSVFAILILKFRYELKQFKLLFLFFFTIQLLLLASWSSNLYAGSSLRDIVSLLRPTFLFITCIAFLGIVNSYEKDYFKLYVSLRKAFLLLVFLILVSYLAKNSPVENIYYFLYEISDKKVVREGFVSFYGFTYYAGFVYFLIFLFFLSSFRYFGGGVNLMALMLCCFFVVASNSKPFLLSMVVLLAIYPFSVKGFGKILYVFVVLIVSYLIYHFWDNIYNFLSSVSYAFKGLLLILAGGQVGSLDVRLEQIVQAWNSSADNFGIGAGLGVGILLESHLAEWLFRYGIIGFFVHFIFYLMLLVHSMTVLSKSKNKNLKVLALFCFLWVLFLPITLSSSLMTELSKMAAFSMFVYALNVSIGLQCARAQYRESFPS